MNAVLIVLLGELPSRMATSPVPGSVALAAPPEVADQFVLPEATCHVLPLPPTKNLFAKVYTQVN